MSIMLRKYLQKLTLKEDTESLANFGCLVQTKCMIIKITKISFSLYLSENN